MPKSVRGTPSGCLRDIRRERFLSSDSPRVERKRKIAGSREWRPAGSPGACRGASGSSWVG